MPHAAVHDDDIPRLGLKRRQQIRRIRGHVRARGPPIGTGDVPRRSIIRGNVRQAPDDVERPDVLPRVGEDYAHVRVQRHAGGAGARDVGREVGDEEVVAQHRLDHVDGRRVRDQLAEDGVQLEQVEDAHVALVRVEPREEGVVAARLGRFFGFPEAGEDRGGFGAGEH